MGYTEFRAWADDRGLSRKERDIMLLNASNRGREIAHMEREDWEELAREVGLVVGAVRRFVRWLKGFFG